VNPRLIDLIAALATGAVGSVALVRRDISDTLPGIAIAISLVPPLTVVGLTAESRAWDESFGALFLFGTNVASILATGIVVMALYRVYQMVTPAAWADSVEWEVIEVSTTADSVNVRVIGSPPIPETASYRDALVAGGIDPDGVVVEFIPRTVVALGDNFVGLVPD